MRIGYAGLPSSGSAGTAPQQGDVNNAASAAAIMDALAVARYDLTPPTLTDGRFNALQVGSRGSLHVELWGTSSISPVGVGGYDTDAASASTTRLGVLADRRAFNDGTGNTERVRNNVSGTLLASASRSATVSSSDQTNWNNRGVRVTINMTVVPGGDTVTPTVEEKDPVSGLYTAMLTGAAIVGTGLVILTVYPGVTVAANVAVSQPLPRTWRVTMTHSAGTAFTYSVGYATIG